MGWRPCVVKVVERQKLWGPAQTQPGCSMPILRSELGIKTRISPMQLVNKLQVVEHRHRRQPVLDREELAPARMPDHKIRFESLGKQLDNAGGDCFRPLASNAQIKGPGVRGSACSHW